MTDMTAPKPYIPAVAKICAPLAPYALPMLRIFTGLTIAYHGYPKIFLGGTTGLAGLMTRMGLEPALGWAWLVGITEFFGGIMLAIGLLTRFVSAALVIEFAVIVCVLKWANGFLAMAPKAIQPGFPGMIPGGFELELTLGLICLAFVFAGGGRLSVDRAIGREI